MGLHGFKAQPTRETLSLYILGFHLKKPHNGVKWMSDDGGDTKLDRNKNVGVCLSRLLDQIAAKTWNFRVISFLCYENDQKNFGDNGSLCSVFLSFERMSC